MPKTLSERIAARATPLRRSASNRAAFLALRPDIQQALADGWPVKTVWETLHTEGAIQFGYDAFLGYAKRLLGVQPLNKHRAAPRTAPPPAPPSSPTGFHYDPSPKKEELF